jgi:hypothetical protein
MSEAGGDRIEPRDPARSRQAAGARRGWRQAAA